MCLKSFHLTSISKKRNQVQLFTDFGHKSEQAPRDGEGQGSLECCSPWDCKESDATEQLLQIYSEKLH